LSAVQEAIQIAVDEFGYARVTGKLSAEGIPFTEENGRIIISIIIQKISPNAVWHFTSYEAKDSKALCIKKTKLRR
jgi:hypothetical protein